MAVYLLTLLLIYIVSTINSIKLTRLDFIFFIFLSTLSGFRYGVGTDFFEYDRYFSLIEQGQVAPTDVGYNYLGSLVSAAGLNSQALFFVFSVLTIGFIYFGLKYYMQDNYMVKHVLYIILIIFTFIPSMNGIRQALAAAIMFYGTKYIIEKKPLKYFSLMILATLFHPSSLFFIIIYFIANKNFSRITLFAGIFISIILVNLGMITNIFEFVLTYAGFLDIGGYIENYLYSSYNSREVSYGIVFYINVIVLLLVMIVKDRIIDKEKNLVAFNLFYLYILIYILSMDAPMLTRMTYFFSIYMALVISRFPIIFEVKSRKVVKYTMICLYSLLFIYIILNGYLNPGQTDFIPYKSNFNLFE